MADVALSMHINHRRKNKHRAKHHNERGTGFGLAYSLKPVRQEFWRRARAQARHLMTNDRFDELPDRYPNSVLWDYW